MRILSTKVTNIVQSCINVQQTTNESRKVKNFCLAIIKSAKNSISSQKSNLKGL